MRPSKVVPIIHYEITKPVLNRPRSAISIAKTDIAAEKQLSSSKRYRVKKKCKHNDASPIIKEDLSPISIGIAPK